MIKSPFVTKPFQKIPKKDIDTTDINPDIYQKNMRALHRAKQTMPRYRQLIEQLNQIPSIKHTVNKDAIDNNASDYRIHQAHYGLSLSYKNISLYAEEGPLPEIKTLLLNHCHTSTDTHHIVFGLGLGYLVESVFNYSKGHVHIYEPNLHLLKLIITSIDISHLLNSERVHLLTHPSGLSDSLHQHYMHGDTVDLLYLQSTAALWQSKLPCVIRDVVKPAIERKKNSVDVTLAYHHQWCESFFQSLPYLPKANSFAILNNTVKQHSKPAIIISAGPSLDKNILALKKMSPYATLICVGRALKLLLENDIIPDYCVFLDFEGPAQQLSNVPSSVSEVNFILGPFAQPCCYQTRAKHHYYIHLESYSGFAQWLNATFEENAPMVTGGGTVSMLALNAGIAMGHSNIILLGQDLAFQGTQIYAGDVHVNQLHDQRYTFSEINTASGNTLNRDIPVVEIRGQQGETLLTGQDYDLYRQHFEEMARDINQNTSVKLFNASTGGAHIEGFELISLSDYKHTYINPETGSPARALTLDSKQASPQQNKRSASQRSQQLLKRLFDTLKHIEAMRLHANTIIKQHPILTALLEREQSTTRVDVSRKTSKELQQHQKNLKQFSKKLVDHPVVYYALQREVWLMHRRSHQEQRSQSKLDLLERVQRTIELDVDYIKACLHQLETVQIMTYDAIEALQSNYPLNS